MSNALSYASRRYESDNYWKREETTIGRLVNDASDRLGEAAGRLRLEARILVGTSPLTEREVFKSKGEEIRYEKSEWREHYKKTGELVPGAVKEAWDQAWAERQLSQSPDHIWIQERRAELASDATIDRADIDRIVRVEQRRLEERTTPMDNEVKAARQHVREREQERWDRVEQVGRQAIQSDKAQAVEKQSVFTTADEATRAERQRPQST